MIDAVIFDKDGTLFDFRASWGAYSQRLLDLFGTGPAHRAALAQAIGFDPSTNRFTPDSLVIAATAAEIAEPLLPLLPQFSHGALTDRLNALSLVAPMVPVVDLPAVLGALRARGLRIGLATNDTEAPARAHLQRAGVEQLFDFIAGCDSGHGGKPAPGMLLAFARDHDLTPSRVVMVGDSRHDLQAGRAAGMHTVAVLTGIAGAAELAPHADAVLADIGALGAWIDGLNAA